MTYNMPQHSGSLSKEVLQAALDGLETQRARIEEHIAEVRSLLGARRRGRPPKAEAADREQEEPKSPGRKRRARLSPEGRAKIIAALKKRWAAAKAGQAARPGATKRSRKASKKAAANSSE